MPTPLSDISIFIYSPFSCAKIEIKASSLNFTPCFKLFSIIGKKQHAHDDLYAVVNHRLNVDIDGGNKYVVGVEEYRHAAKQREGGKEGANALTNLALFQERRERQKV